MSFCKFVDGNHLITPNSLYRKIAKIAIEFHSLKQISSPFTKKGIKQIESKFDIQAVLKYRIDFLKYIFQN